MTRLKVCEGSHQTVTDSKGILLQMLLFEHIQDRQARRAGDRIAPKGAEEFHAIVEARRNFGSRNNSRKRKRVPDWLAQNDDVGHNTLSFKTPEMCADSAKAHLDFVCNTHSTGRTNVTIHIREISWGKHDLARYTGHALRNKCSGPPAFLPQKIDDFADMACITRSEVEFSSPVDAAIIIGDWGYMDPGFASASARSVEFIWTDVDECGRVPVVGMLQDDSVVASGTRTRKAKSEFVRFASGIQEIADSQRI